MTPEEKALAKDIASFTQDPLGFVLYAFPWGEPNTDLAESFGPEQWQRDVLIEIGEKLRAGSMTVQEAIQMAVASGHGIGKSALVSFIILWAMSTFEDTKGVVTANTETQLKTKTWAELAKWYRLCITKRWFDLTATAMFSKDPKHEKTWRIDMVPWSERNTEAFAGLHNKKKRILVIFDEASSIPDLIFEVTEGALTDSDTEIVWCCFGNPTKNTGRFRECFGRFKHRWSCRQIDSRSVSITNKEQIQKWVDDYGEDSDFVRVRVRGVFPRAGSNQLIDAESVHNCRKLTSEEHNSFRAVLGVDVARFGDDQTVFTLRQGRKVFPQRRFRQLDLMQVADKTVEFIKEANPKVVFVDGIGMGAGVVDRLRQLGYGHMVIDVNVGSKASNEQLYVNKRAEVWCRMRDYLVAGADIPDDQELEDDLIGVEYGFDNKQRIVLEKKEDMKKRGLASPDNGDSLALTFAEEICAEDVEGAAYPEHVPDF